MTEIENQVDERVNGILELASRMGLSIEIINHEDKFNRTIRITSRDAKVRVGADRGIWYAELGPNGSEEYFDSATWLAVLSSTPVSLEVAPLTEQCGVLEALLLTVDFGSVDVEALKEARRQGAIGRQSLPPPPPGFGSRG